VATGCLMAQKYSYIGTQIQLTKTIRTGLTNSDCLF
jgi:hypothetical protein